MLYLSVSLFFIWSKTLYSFDSNIISFLIDVADVVDVVDGVDGFDGADSVDGDFLNLIEKHIIEINNIVFIIVYSKLISCE